MPILDDLLDDLLPIVVPLRVESLPDAMPIASTTTDSERSSATPTFVMNDGPPTDLPAEVASPRIVSIVDPFEGEIIDLNAAESSDVDALITLYEKLDRINGQAYAVMLRIRERLANMAEGDAKTRRVRGKNRVAKIELSDVRFESAVLKQLWEEFPKLRDECLKIDAIGVKAREYAKLATTASDDPQFTAFRDRLTAACKGRTGTPALKIEK